MEQYLIDTNVMLAASSHVDGSSVADRAMPLDRKLRLAIFNWLSNFSESNEHLVLDYSGLIVSEYYSQLNNSFFEFGLLVYQSKYDLGRVELVEIETLEANGEHIALLSEEHETIVTDRADRKWVACALKTSKTTPIVYGAETDWYIARESLEKIGVNLVPLLPTDWYEEKVSQI